MLYLCYPFHYVQNVPPKNLHPTAHPIEHNISKTIWQNCDLQYWTRTNFVHRAAVNTETKKLTFVAWFGGQKKGGEAPKGHPIVAYAFHPVNQPPHALSTNQHMTSDQSTYNWTHNLRLSTAITSYQSKRGNQSIVIL